MCVEREREVVGAVEYKIRRIESVFEMRVCSHTGIDLTTKLSHFISWHALV